MLLGTSWAGAETSADNRPEGERTPFAVNTTRDTSSSDQSPIALERSASTVRELFGADRPGGFEPGEHPLVPALRWAKNALPVIEGLKDYSATLLKREQVNGTLGSRQLLWIKVRQKPFSVYTRGLAPAAIEGQEAIYVAGRNNGKVLVHPAGRMGNLVHTLSLHPDGKIAMRDHRHPITEIGIVNLVRQLIVAAERDVRHDECEVRYFAGGKINGHDCTWFQVVHPVPRPYFRFHLARIFVDEQLKIPVRYEAYSWPRDSGGEPELLEEYSYVDLKVNNGFSDEDFSIENPAYHFR
jgi:hypothetical protein